VSAHDVPAALAGVSGSAGSASPVADLGWRETGRRLVGSLEVAGSHPNRWVAGFGYQFLALGWAFGIAASLAVVVHTMPGSVPTFLGFRGSGSAQAMEVLHALRLGSLNPVMAGWLVLFVVASLRLAPGLARSLLMGDGMLPREATRRAGRGFGLSTAALWSQVAATMLAASAVGVLSWFGLLELVGANPDQPMPKVVTSVLLGFLFVYGATLGALYHLALASLVRHRRGAGSAFLHAWRLVRSQPAGAARAITTECGLYGVLLYVEWLIPKAINPYGIASFIALALCGLTRAGFWSRTYHALGGVEPALP